MAIDDTSVSKPHAENTEGAQCQYCGVLGRQENCNIAVASCFVPNTKMPSAKKSLFHRQKIKSQRFRERLEN